MKKLTAKEILEIVKKHFTIEDFGGGGFGAPDGFIFSDEVYRLEKLYNDNLAKLRAHPGYSDRKLIDDELSNLSDEYRKLHKEYFDLQDKEYFDSLGLGKIVEIEQHGGEGEGSNWYSIKHFVYHNVYIKTKGYYQSHSGIEFYDGYGEEIFPIQKTITVYE